MAVFVESSYGKTIGLPQYSSHRFSLSIKTEVTDLDRIPGEAERIYLLLQQAVDEQIGRPGFIPPRPGSVQAEAPGANGPPADSWNCLPRQKEQILSLVQERELDRWKVEDLARERFGAGVRQLDPEQAAALIDELRETQDAEKASRAPRRKGRRKAAATERGAA